VFAFIVSQVKLIGPDSQTIHSLSILIGMLSLRLGSVVDGRLVEGLVSRFLDMLERPDVNHLSCAHVFWSCAVLQVTKPFPSALHCEGFPP
jgi:hypothetical protein